MSPNAYKYLTTILVLLVTSAALGQSDGTALLDDTELANARALLQAGREQIIREDLQLTEEEAIGFWPVYEDYIAALAVVRDRKAKLVTGFVQAYRAGAIGDEYAEWLIAENFDIKAEWLQAQKKFVRKFRKVLPVVKVARFYQLENKMDAEVDAQLAIVVPLVEAM